MLELSNLLPCSFSLCKVPGMKKLLNLYKREVFLLVLSKFWLTASPSWSLLSPRVRDERKGRITFQITVEESLRHRLELSLSEDRQPQDDSA